MDFDPNTTLRGAWATFVPKREPKFKVHAQRNHATNAVREHWSNVILFEQVDGQWVERFRSQDMSANGPCGYCGKPVNNSYERGVHHDGGSVDWRRDENGKRVEPLELIRHHYRCRR